MQVEMTEGGVEVFLSYEVRSPSEALHSHSFTATSSDGLTGVYVPYPNPEANAFITSLKRKMTGDDSVELFGTLIGTSVGMKNSYKLNVAEGYDEDIDNYAPRVVGNALAMIVSLCGALLLSM